VLEFWKYTLKDMTTELARLLTVLF